MTLIDIYKENRNEQNIVAVNENLVGSILLSYILDIEKQQVGPITKIQYEPQELYNDLLDYAENNNVRIDGRQFPKDSANLVKKIKTVIPNFKAGYGINIEIGRSKDNTSTITIHRKKTSTVTTTISDYASSARPLHIHLYTTEVLRKNQVNYYYCNQAKSENIYAVDKTPIAEYNNSSSIGGLEASEAIFSKSTKDILQNNDDIICSNSKDNNTEQIANSVSNQYLMGDRNEI
jgi:hypothetical protein